MGGHKLGINIFNEQVKEEESVLKIRKNLGHYGRRSQNHGKAKRTSRHKDIHNLLQAI